MRLPGIKIIESKNASSGKMIFSSALDYRFKGFGHCVLSWQIPITSGPLTSELVI